MLLMLNALRSSALRLVKRAGGAAFAQHRRDWRGIVMARRHTVDQRADTDHASAHRMTFNLKRLDEIVPFMSAKLRCHLT